jgi:hypothetical protein
MGDEASDTFGGGLRNYLGALAFISALIGAEIIREHGPLWVGVILIVIALPIYLSPISLSLLDANCPFCPHVLGCQMPFDLRAVSLALF